MQTLLTFGQATSNALREKITTINSDRTLLTKRIHEIVDSSRILRIFPPNFFTKENNKLIYNLLDTFIDRYISKIFGQLVVADTFNTGFCEFKIADTFNKILPIQSFFSLEEYSGNNTFDYVFGNLLSVSLLDQNAPIIDKIEHLLNEIKCKSYLFM